MHLIKSDEDSALTSFLCEYLDGSLSPAVNLLFEECMHRDYAFASYVHKCDRSKIALKNTYQVVAADDFEEKLASRIAREG